MDEHKTVMWTINMQQVRSASKHFGICWEFCLSWVQKRPFIIIIILVYSLLDQRDPFEAVGMLRTLWTWEGSGSSAASIQCDLTLHLLPLDLWPCPTFDFWWKWRAAIRGRNCQGLERRTWHGFSSSWATKLRNRPAARASIICWECISLIDWGGYGQYQQNGA